MNGADDQEASGTLRVSKFGYWEERDTDNNMWGTEGIRTWIEHQQ